MPFAQLPSGRVHYLDSGSGPPLVLLSANPGDSRDYAAVMPELARHYRVLALDWPGYGSSDIPTSPGTMTVLRFYQTLVEFLDALKIPSALFIGNSVGGNAAARLAIEQPQRVSGLVPVAAGGFTPHNAITRLFCRWMGTRFAMSPKMWASLYLRKRTPLVREMLQRAAGEQSSAPRLEMNHALWRSFAGPDNDLRAIASAIQAPVLLVHGRDDPAIPASKDGKVAERCIPNSRLLTMPCGHAAFAEMPAEFLQEALPFLQGCARSPLRAAA